MQPEPGEAVARREAQGFVHVGPSFFGVTDEYLGETDVPVSSGQIRIERQRSLELGNALVGAIGLVQDAAHDLVGERIVRPQRKHPGYLCLGRREPGIPVVRQKGSAY